MNLVLDAGALIALDRGDRDVAGLVAIARRAAADLVTVAPVVGQVWRLGARQALLVRVLAGTDVRVVDQSQARTAGELLGRTTSSDVVDALLASVVLPHDQVLTSDPGDITELLAARAIDAQVVRV